MKSIKAIPISHPTKPFLDAQLVEANKRLSLLSFLVDRLDWGKRDESLKWKWAIPVPNHMDSAWLTVVYELETLDDYNEACALYEKMCQKIRSEI